MWKSSRWAISALPTLPLRLLVVLLLIVAKVQSEFDLRNCAKHKKCLAAVNERTVKTIRSSMCNESNACNNFFTYACDEWESDYRDNFEAVDEYYTEKLRKYLERKPAAAAKEPLTPLLQKLRVYYNSCQQAYDYDAMWKHYLINRPRMPNAQWPDDFATDLKFESAESWAFEGRHFDWLAAIAELRRYGFNLVLLEEAVGMANNNSRQNVIELGMPKTKQSYHNTDSVIERMQLLQLISYKERPSQLAFAEKIVAFSQQLEELRSRHLIKSNSTRLLTLAQLQLEVPQLNWQRYFNILLGQQHTSPRLLIELSHAAYFQEMAALLSQTAPRTVCYYMFLHLTDFLLDMSPSQIGPQYCTMHLQLRMALGMDFLYDRKLYNTRAQDERVIDKIFDQLKQQFQHYLQRNRLHLQPVQLAYMQQKLAKVALRIGNLPKQPDSYFNAYYASANISEAAGFYANHWELLRHHTQKQHDDLLLAPADNTLEHYFVNDDITYLRSAPYYVQERNLIIVPLSFVQLPFYHHRQHALLQYSLMGWILAHELTHAFETIGVLLDADGNESPIGLSIANQASFQNAVSCFERRPSEMLAERLADVNGFQLVYDAYFGAELNTSFASPTERYPFAPDFSARRLFFLNFAQFFCGQVPYDIAHDQDDVRVREVAANMREFAEEFHCGPNDVENPLPKCELWK